MPDLTVPTPPPLASVRGVELIRTGTWQISTGEWTATSGDLAAAVAALACPGVRRPVLKLGHTDPRFDGEPAVGWVDNLNTADAGSTLLGDYVGMPGWLGDVIASAYPDRSVEGIYDFRCQVGHVHPFVLTGVALLGVTAPGVGNLASLQDVAALYGVAASTDGAGTRVATTPRTDVPLADEPVRAAAERTTMPNPTPIMVAANVSTEDVRRAYYDDAGYDYWITEFHLDPPQLIVCDDRSGKHFRVPIALDGDAFTFGEQVEVAVEYVDKPAADTSAEPVAAKRMVFASRAESRGEAQATADPADEPPSSDPTHLPSTPATPPVTPAVAPLVTPPEVPAPTLPAAEPEPTTEPKEDPVSLSDEMRSRLGLADDADEAAALAAIDALKAQAETPAQPDPQLVAASTAARDEMKTEIERLSGELASIKASAAADSKKSLFDSAVSAGKLKPADREGWEARYDRAPEVITEILASIAPNTAVPVAAAGHTGSPDVDVTDEALMKAFFPPADVARFEKTEA